MSGIDWLLLLFFTWIGEKVLVLIAEMYRVRRGKKQLMDWLSYLGQHMDRDVEDGVNYTKDAYKEYIAKITAQYFGEVRKNRRW